MILSIDSTIVEVVASFLVFIEYSLFLQVILARRATSLIRLAIS